ncbi:MAG TPA: hypothetical protein VFU05_18105, partial [Cyclobacteriaceae bacterium]|nr:hypothetical protein [Cyclobacteriaceae bacterium]
MNKVDHRKKVITATLSILMLLLPAYKAFVMGQVQEPSKQYPIVTDYPEEVQKVIDQIKTREPDAEYQVLGVMEMNTLYGQDVLENVFKTYNKSDYKSTHIVKDVSVSSASAFKHYVVLVKGTRAVVVVPGTDG